MPIRILIFTNIINYKAICQVIIYFYHCLIGNLGVKMTNIRRLLAYNIREGRRRLSLSQAKLAEKSDISTQYLAMIEIERKFPSPEVLEKLAFALGMDTPELFSMPPSLELSAKRLQNEILIDIEKSLGETLALAAKKAVTGIVDRHLEKTQ